VRWQDPQVSRPYSTFLQREGRPFLPSSVRARVWRSWSIFSCRGGQYWAAVDRSGATTCSFLPAWPPSEAPEGPVAGCAVTESRGPLTSATWLRRGSHRPWTPDVVVRVHRVSNEPSVTGDPIFARQLLPSVRRRVVVSVISLGGMTCLLSGSRRSVSMRWRRRLLSSSWKAA